MVDAQITDSVNTKGVKIPVKKVETGVTRAVLVGISDYQDEGIPDLKYAHKDIQVFYNYLTSQAGNTIPDENIKMFLNDQATGGNVHKALYWLVKESKENDVCIIYFSGHGDVETIYPDEPGHFLLYDSPSSIYQINSLRIDDLKRITRTLSEQNKAQVYLYSDACRSGKLAGSEVSGAQATSAALATQFANEVKIMSCQPNEYSVEGPEWGGGRGIFSYYLVDGLIGLADNDQNQLISLKEIQRYLEDRFEEDLKNQTQTPMIVGNRSANISIVNEVSLIALKNAKNLVTQDQEELASVVVNKKQINHIDKDLQGFYTAIEHKILLVSDESTNDKSAEYYYHSIEKNKDLSTKLPIIKGDLISALQDEAQAAINRYLAVDYAEMLKRYKNEESNYQKYPSYLEKAAELLTPTHYLYPQIKAKALYFSTVSKRLELDRLKANPKEYELLEDNIIKALTYDGNAPYLWNELGLLYHAQAKFDKAETNFDKAIEKSPTWVLPYQNKTNISIKQKKYQEAIQRANLSLEIDSAFAPAYAHLSEAYYAIDSLVKAITYDQKLIDFFGNDICVFYNNKGDKYFNLRQFDNALTSFDESISCDSNQVLAYLNKVEVLIATDKTDDAIALLLSLIQKSPLNPKFPDKLGYAYRKNKDLTNAEKYYRLAMSIDPKSAAYSHLGYMLLNNNRPADALPLFDYYLEHIDPKDKWTYFDKACAYASLGDIEQFKINMEKAISNNFTNLREYQQNTHFNSIRTSEAYKSFLIKLK